MERAKENTQPSMYIFSQILTQHAAAKEAEENEVAQTHV